MKMCANCGEPIRLSDGRYKYCSEECAADGHRRLCRENYHRRYWTNREAELERSRRNWAKKKMPNG